MSEVKPTWQRPVLLAEAGSTYSKELRSAIRWALVTIDTQQAEIERLRAENELLDCRAGKLLRKRKTFVVVAIDEPYFTFVFDLIRKQEKHKGQWTTEDEQWYQSAMREWADRESAKAAGGE